MIFPTSKILDMEICGVLIQAKTIIPTSNIHTSNNQGFIYLIDINHDSINSSSQMNL
jgi:hypothetical protein